MQWLVALALPLLVAVVVLARPVRALRQRQGRYCRVRIFRQNASLRVLLLAAQHRGWRGAALLTGQRVRRLRICLMIWLVRAMQIVELMERVAAKVQ
jgi:hypothetical protein